MGNLTGNRGSVPFEYLYGNIRDKLSWPTGSLPINFTVCSLTRYAGNTNKRILMTSDGLFVLGHSAGVRGAISCGSLSNPLNTIPTSNYKLTDWLVMCVKSEENSPDNVLIDNIPSGLRSGCVSDGRKALSINLNRQFASEFALAQLLIWKETLSDDDMMKMSEALTLYLKTGLFTEVPTGQPTMQVEDVFHILQYDLMYSITNQI